jgi:hypothetical protein
MDRQKDLMKSHTSSFIALMIENFGEILVPCLLEPTDGLILGDALALANLALAQFALGHAVPSALHHNVKIHAVNARVGVILDAEIDVLADTESPVACKLEKDKPAALSREMDGLFQAHRSRRSFSS